MTTKELEVLKSDLEAFKVRIDKFKDDQQSIVDDQGDEEPEGEEGNTWDPNAEDNAKLLEEASDGIDLVLNKLEDIEL